MISFNLPDALWEWVKLSPFYRQMRLREVKQLAQGHGEKTVLKCGGSKNYFCPILTYLNT